MEIDSTLEKIGTLYEEGFEEHGYEPRSMGWRDQASHNLRFEKLLASFSLEEAFSINDLGCGYAALYHYLRDTVGIPAKNIDYHGYDLSSSLLQAAKKKAAPDKLSLYHASTISTVADYSVASGIFNVRFDAFPDAWREHVLETLENLDEMSTKGFSFNLLSSYVDYEEPHLYYGDPCFFFDYCKRHFSKKVVLYHDTDLWEWTLVVLKGE